MSEWISVEDRLPDIDTPVWIDSQTQAGIGARCSMGDGEWLWGFAEYAPHWDSKDGWVIESYDLDDIYPTHWMPLPTPQQD